MRHCWIVGLLCMLALAVGGCASSGGETAHEAELRTRLAAAGVRADAGSMRWWRDVSGETTFVVGRKDQGAGEHSALVLLRDDRAEPMVVDLKGIDLTTQWVDAEGRVWSVPGFVSAAERAGMNSGSIDPSSGLFITCNLKQQGHPFRVGRMNTSDGWVFSDSLPPQVKSGLLVSQRGDDIVVSEAWSMKVNGPRELRPYHWVYSPDPSAPGRYRRTDSYR